MVGQFTPQGSLAGSQPAFQNLRMAFSRISFRAPFDDRLTAKENKDALKDSVQEALASLGLAIDEGDVKFHHRKLVRKKNKKPKFVVMGLDVAEGESMDRMKASAVFAEGAGGRFTVRWGEAAEQGTNDASSRSADKKTESEGVAGRKETNSKTEKKKKKSEGGKGASMGGGWDRPLRWDPMTGALMAGVVCVVMGVMGAGLMGWHHSRSRVGIWR